MVITRDIKYIGVNDRKIDLFEEQYRVQNGMAYNSYVILDDEIAVIDAVDAHFGDEWLNHLNEALGGRSPDYLVVQHMEPDHSGSLALFMETYPQAKVVSSKKSFKMMEQFFGTDYPDRQIIVAERNQLPLGRHTLQFIGAPMVHWPEVLMTYDQTDRVLFSADAFGKFGAIDAAEDWTDEARRYYFAIVGKYGAQVQALLKKAADLSIETVCPLHGPVLKDHWSDSLRLYRIWSSYGVETDGVFIAYTSVYGHTKAAVELLKRKLEEKGCPRVTVADLARCDMAEAIANAFRYGKIILATTTHNSEIFPPMQHFLTQLVERNFQNRTVAFLENGSWSPNATKVMKKMLEPCQNLKFSETRVSILSSMNEESKEEIEKLAAEFCREDIARSDRAEKYDLTALFKIGYGIYVVTCKDGEKDNGLIVNTVAQLTSSPNRIAVTINKANYSHDIIKKTGKLNVNCLTVETPFYLIENFGFRSGREVDKFEEMQQKRRSENGLIVLPNYINSFLSLSVERYLDFDSHGMFVCTITESRVISPVESMTYSYYQEHIKPKPNQEAQKGWVCKVCGYVYEGETLPDDFICPLCKHGASDFEKIG